MNAEYFIDAICKDNSLDIDKLKSRIRKPPYQDIRRVVFNVLRIEFKLNSCEIMRIMNMKSSASIRKSFEVHQNYMKYNRAYRELYQNNLKILI